MRISTLQSLKTSITPQFYYLLRVEEKLYSAMEDRRNLSATLSLSLSQSLESNLSQSCSAVKSPAELLFDATEGGANLYIMKGLISIYFAATVCTRASPHDSLKGILGKVALLIHQSDETRPQSLSLDLSL